MTHEFNGQRYARASAHQKEWAAKLTIRETQQPDGRCFETSRRINLLARK